MIGHGYSKYNYGNCLYFKQFSCGVFVYLLLYVDDMLITSTVMSVINKLKYQLSDKFEMKNFGVVKKILDMEIERDC